MSGLEQTLKSRQDTLKSLEKKLEAKCSWNSTRNRTERNELLKKIAACEEDIKQLTACFEMVKSKSALKV